MSDSTKALATALARFDEAPKPNEELSMRWYRHDAGGILAALPPDAHLFTVDSLADIVERHVLPDDYYRVEPDTPFGPEETWFDAGAFAAAIIEAAKEASDGR